MHGLARSIAGAVLAGGILASCSAAPRPPQHPVAAAQAPSPAPDAVATILTGLQEDLRALGYDPGAISGMFSAPTTAALIRFQDAAGVDPGERSAFGPATARALTARLPHASEAVRALQSALTDVGLFHGVINGQYGDDLLGAVRALQHQAGLSVDGQYGTKTAGALDALYRRLVPGAPPAPATTTTAAAPTTTTNPDNMLTLGSQSARVTAVQQRLTDLGYRPGPVNGFYGADTASAVLAFEKREGLPRDGIAGPVVQGRLAAPSGEGARSGLPVPRIEVDIARQIAFIVLAGQPTVTLNVSTGSGQHYQDPTTKADDVAYTPVGTFAVQRAINADVQAPLGTLHRPLYFYEGWAVHGAASVPAWPASHGCVRVSDDDADWLFPLIPIGTTVVIYDTTAKNPGTAAAPAGATPGY